jgi:uncharacterized membrane protein YphA (DoxX/SURF4 family)
MFALVASIVIPSTVIWSYSVGALVFIVGLIAIFVRGEWHKARGIDKLLLFAPLIYAAPLAAFGTEHFTLTAIIASIIPKWIPWHMFWAYLVGASFIAAALSLVTGIQARLAALCLAATFFLFVLFMDGPAWPRIPQNRFVLVLTLRELSFSAGALAFAGSLTAQWRERGTHIFATIARYVIAVTALVYSVEQFLHGDRVPGVPLEPLTPTYVPGHAVWTYVAAVAYAITGILLLLGKKTRAAAAWLGATVLLIELVVYVPIGIVERASLAKGLNYVFDTLLFGGAVLLLARAMPPSDQTASQHTPQTVRPT